MAEILHPDLTTCKVEDFVEFYSDFEFEVNCDCKITAIGGCFDTNFAQEDFRICPQALDFSGARETFDKLKSVQAKKGQNVITEKYRKRKLASHILILKIRK